MKRNAGQMLSRRMPLIILVALGAAASLYLSSCTPGSDLTAPESDVVVTLFNHDVDFSAITTYAMPDTIVHIVVEGGSDQVSRKYDNAILDLMAANLDARGYVRIEAGSSEVPDVLVLVSATSVDYWYWYSYYPGDYWGWYPGWSWWGGYPGWGWGYPPPSYGTSYAYTTGTLFVNMVDPAEPDAANELIAAYWLGVCNGVLNDTTPSKQARISDSINQLFKQSPYLRSSGH